MTLTRLLTLFAAALFVTQAQAQCEVKVLHQGNLFQPDDTLRIQFQYPCAGRVYAFIPEMRIEKNLHSFSPTRLLVLPLAQVAFGLRGFTVKIDRGMENCDYNQTKISFTIDQRTDSLKQLCQTQWFINGKPFKGQLCNVNDTITVFTRARTGILEITPSYFHAPKIKVRITNGRASFIVPSSIGKLSFFAKLTDNFLFESCLIGEYSEVFNLAKDP